LTSQSSRDYSLAAERKLIAQIALGVEDPRTHLPRMKVPPVNLQPVPNLLKHTPELHVMVLKPGNRGSPEVVHLGELGKIGNVYVNIGMREQVGRAASLITADSPSRGVLGSHYPMLYFESSVLKAREACKADDQAKAVPEGDSTPPLPR